MLVKHPQRGDLKVMMKGGCPHVTRAEALNLISELENIKLGIPEKAAEFGAEIAWMRKLVQQHRVFCLPYRTTSRIGWW